MVGIVLIAGAVKQAWDEDGVLVLMDLGSAVLSAEMAAEMLPDEQRSRVLLCEAPLVEGAVAVAVAARLGQPLDQVAAEARGGLAGKAAHLGAPAPQPPASVEAQPGTAAAGTGALELPLVVRNPLGLHARPAARFVQTAGRFDATTTAENLTTHAGPASARSLNGIATLGVLRGHEVLVRAAGPQAAEALSALRDLAERDFDEPPASGIARILDGRPLIIRTLDVGADKPLPYLPREAEPNPALGQRGIRLGLARPDLLRTQVRAIIRVAARHPVKLMFPMVTTADEVRSALDLVAGERRFLAAAGVAVPAAGAMETGIMIEVPAAALAAAQLAGAVDFFSVGTNDLTQYTMAVDRELSSVAGLGDAIHPAVLTLIGRAAAASADAGRWTGVCGELAADSLAVPLLLGLGVRELSVSAAAVGKVKQAVRATDLNVARELARQAIRLPSAGAVRELMSRHGTPLPAR